MKTLIQLLNGIPSNWNGKGSLAAPISVVRSDSREVQMGDLFVAVSGVREDGHQYIAEAIRRGAGAVVSERFDAACAKLGIPQFVVSNSRLALAELAACAYDYPARKLKVIGVTGTNGKTTTAFLLQFLLNQVSRAGLIGTVGMDDGSIRESSGNTTPGPGRLNELLARMAANRLSYCVMEVSSHALDQGRTAGIPFSSAAFTNLTQDHLDYHLDLETYFAAKRKLFFGEPRPKHSVINGDDAYGVRLLSECHSVSYGVDLASDYRIQILRADLSAIQFKFIHSGEQFLIKAPLPLRHNVYNLAAALSVLSEEGFDLRELTAFVNDFPGVSGRMERIDEGQEFHVFVDYAHTPDALFHVLAAAGELPKNRIISVFGCGGDRDRMKRPLMGKIASQFSDVVILTSDNPRSEDPLEILSQIKSGMDAGNARVQALELMDRAEAIQRAVELAEEGDLVFIFGKGHEDYQIFGSAKVPFSDQETARFALRRRCSTFKKLPKFAAER